MNREAAIARAEAALSEAIEERRRRRILHELSPWDRELLRAFDRACTDVRNRRLELAALDAGGQPALPFGREVA